MEKTILFCGGELQVVLMHDCMAVEKNSHVVGILSLKDCFGVHTKNLIKIKYWMCNRFISVSA
jgi:hypothetical protein